jgi:hypothetical protein
MKDALTCFLLSTILMFSSVSVVHSGTDHESRLALPRVAAAAVPLYPPLARATHVEGIVHVKIKTDGRRVVAVHVEDGHSLLAEAAEKNVQTWEFQVHEATSFTVTYHYKLVPGLKGDPENPEVILRLPTYVEVRIMPKPPILDPAPYKR